MTSEQQIKTRLKRLQDNSYNKFMQDWLDTAALAVMAGLQASTPDTKQGTYHKGCAEYCYDAAEALWKEREKRYFITRKEAK